MGFTAIWPTPMLENNTRNFLTTGAITDHYKIDPRMGTNELYQKLSKEAKSKGIKLIKDVVLNHVGFIIGGTQICHQKIGLTMLIFIKIQLTTENHHDPYAVNIDKKDFTDGWFVKQMPDLNQRNPILARYLIQNSLWWIEYGQLSDLG